MLDCYIINLDRAKDRWDTIFSKFSKLDLNIIRVPGIEGKTLEMPCENVSPWRYFLFYGRPLHLTAVGCYLSHIKALRQFLDSGKEHALICEDDGTPDPRLPEIIHEALQYADRWDLLRLNGLNQPPSITFAKLSEGFELCSDLRYTSCVAGIVVNRTAAQKIIGKLLPMRMPYDVALYYDFPIGIREASVKPYPIRFVEWPESCIGEIPRYPLFHPAIIRYLTVLPYRIISRLYRLRYRKIFAEKQAALK